jgi:putative nucleotidyltransferase with HDIG domain
VALPVPRDLPVLPGPRVRAMVVLWNPDAKIEHIVSVVEGDPALTAAMLRAANSALSAPIEPITRAREAVLRMGWATSRQIITAALAGSQFDRLDESGLDVQDLWRHLLATGLLSEALATTPEQRSMAFVCGLLHDIGRLSMAAQNPPRYEQVVELVRHGIPVDDAERRRYGLTHNAWGARVCEAWGLPAMLTEAASQHHEPRGEGIASLV